MLDLGTRGYRTLDIGDSATGDRRFSSSSGGVNSSGMLLSNEVRREVSEATESRTALGKYDAWLMTIAAGAGRRTCVASSIGVAESSTLYGDVPLSALA